MHTVLIFIKIEPVILLKLSFDDTELLSCLSLTFGKFPVLSSKRNSLKMPELEKNQVLAGKQTILP